MDQLFTFAQELTLAGVTLLLFVIQLVFWLVIYSRPQREERKAKPTEHGTLPAVSIIVYAKNESENLDKYLPALLTQDYPNYEVIVINDGSTDESDDVLKAYENEYKHLYHTYIPEDIKYLSRKKLALTIGIKAAKNEILLFTEANCRPLSDQWVRTMARSYQQQGTDVVLGFCSYGYHKGFLHKLIAYDNLLTGLQYISSALAGHPYTGNGRNLSYRRDLFFRHKGFQKSLNLHAGDDDLFINEAATSHNTAIEYSPESITEMASIEQFKIWKEMKVSRAATRRYYNGMQLTLYRTETISFFLFLAAAISTFAIGITQSFVSLIGIVLYIILYSIKTSVLRKSAQMLQQKPPTLWLPLLDLILPIFNVYVRIYRIFRGKNDYTFRLGK